MPTEDRGRIFFTGLLEFARHPVQKGMEQYIQIGQGPLSFKDSFISDFNRQ